ncbi:MAG: Hydrogenase 3 maturation protease [Candidatus Heimdallarchaeota archaeon LC_2]|nr:MAG: Hydrogenase 3 maturation protease [Candidatus Heimdallarchaeota archaeon LC_2]
MPETNLNHLDSKLISILVNFKKVIIIGLGNPIKGDDGAGVYITEKLKGSQKKNSINILSCYNSPANYLGKIVKFNPDFVLFIDAVYHPNFILGDIVIINPNKILELESFTTHYQNYSVILDFLNKELNKTLDYLVLGINVEEMELADDISEIVIKSSETIISSIKKMLLNA